MDYTRRQLLGLGAGAVTAAAAGPWLLAACSSSGPSAAKATGGPLRIAVTSFGSTETYNPLIAPANTANILQGNVYDWLVDLGPSGPKPGVLRSFTQAPDGSYWDLQLRSNLLFQNGSKATISDLLYTFNQYTTNPMTLRDNLKEALASVQQLNGTTVRAHLNEPMPYFPYTFSPVTPNEGSLLPQQYIEAHGFNYFVKHPIGVGPWKLTNYTTGNEYQYVANKKYWAGVPEFNQLAVIQIPDLNSQFAMLEAGEIDVISVGLDNLSEVQAKYKTYNVFAPQVRFDLRGAYDPRGKGKPIADIRVREALLHAINYDAIKKSILHNIALDRVPPRCLAGMPEVSSSWSSYVETLWAYNPALSKQLLSAAGYPHGFNITMLYDGTTGLSYMEDLVLAVQAYWKAIGVNGSVSILEDGDTSVVGPTSNAVGAAVFTSTGVFGPAPSNMSWVWGTGGDAIGANVLGKKPVIFLPSLINLVNESQTEENSTKRQSMINQFIKIGLDTYTSYTFGQVPSTLATSNRLTFPPFQQPVSQQFAPTFADLAVPAGT
jgi:peptide/nickel transport system substrate-binding protein